MTTVKPIKIGGRKSKLAVVQSEYVQLKIQENFDIECSIVAVSTLGDQRLDKALYSFGGKSVWTKELEILLHGSVGEFPQIDLIVHSLKDVPTKLPEEFELGCITRREDPRDALIMKQGSPYKTLSELPKGTYVGTSSIRRSAQLLKNYPHLKFESVRGNINTRITKLDSLDKFECIILAAAGLIRVGLQDRITKYLNLDDMYYAVGQGALGIEIKKGDERIKSILSKVECLPTTYCCLAERSLMRFLEGGCSVPLGVNTEYNPSNKLLNLKALVVSPDGKECVEAEVSKLIETRHDCEELGIELGKLMIDRGVKSILDKIDYDQLAQLK